MDDLVAWLNTQLDEDEQVARAVVSFDYGVKDWADDGDPVNIHIARWDPDRVLAEVEAKRAILQRYETARIAAAASDGTILAAAARLNQRAFGLALQELALPYRDRPGYRPEWAPQMSG